MDTITNEKVKVDALKSVILGVSKIYEPVKLTYGPDGVNAILPRTYNRGPRITNDGKTISEIIRLSNEHERQAAESFKEGARKTDEMTGDGTTGTTIFGGHLTIKVAKSFIKSDVVSIGGDKTNKSARVLRKEMKDSKDRVIAKIKEMSTPIKSLEDLEKIAIVSIGKEDEETAKAVAKLVWEIGRDSEGNFVNNHIDIVEGYKGAVEIEKIEGMKFPAKAIRQFLTNPERFEMVAEDVPVFITNYKIDNVVEFVTAFNPLKLNKIAIFAPEFSQQVLVSFANSWKNGTFIYPIKCPSLRTEQLEDLASYTGATVVDKDKGNKLKNVSLQEIGFATKIVVKDTENREDATLIGGRGEKMKAEDGKTPIQHRIEILRGQLTEARDEFTRISIEKRIANLCSAVGIIRVGASTTNESLFLKLKIEDGQYACKSALQEGYVKGGGLCLKEIAESLPESDILKESLMEPYNQIQENSGGNLEIGDEIIDSTKTVRYIVEHGVSIASTMITIGISSIEVREKSPAEGYEAIAKEIARYAMYWAKERGVLKESEDMAEEDRNKEFERVMQMDK